MQNKESSVFAIIYTANYHHKKAWRVTCQPIVDTKSANADKQDDNSDEQSSIANKYLFQTLEY